MRPSHRVYDSVLRILPSLYACGTVREFVTRTVALLPSVIKADGYGWFVHSFGPRPTLVDVVESEPCIITSAIAVRLGETVQTHPFSLHWATAKKISAMKFSDFGLMVRERFVLENSDIHREMGRDYLTVPVSFSTNGTHALSVRRDRKWFNEEGRWVMDVLAPHLRQAHANAITFEAETQFSYRSSEFLDAKSIVRLYTEDAVELPPNQAMVKGMAALEKHYTGLLKGNTVKLSLTGLETTSAGDIGYDVGTYSQTITPGTAGAKPMSERGKYVVILRRGADKQWKVKYAIYNSDLPPQPMK